MYFCTLVLNVTWEQGRHKMNRPLQQNVHLPRQKYPASFWCWHCDSISKLSLQWVCKWSITRFEYEFCKGCKALRATHSLYPHLSIHQIDGAMGYKETLPRLLVQRLCNSPVSCFFSSPSLSSPPPSLFLFSCLAFANPQAAVSLSKEALMGGGPGKISPTDECNLDRKYVFYQGPHVANRN